MIGRLAVLGVGLIGGSFALALKRAGMVGSVVGYGRNRDNLEAAQRLGIVDAIAATAGAAVAEALNAEGITLPVLHLGLPDQFIEHGDPARLLAGVGLDATGIEASIRQRFGSLIEGAASLKVVR